MDARLKRLKKHQIYFGTSSWKYPGWKGLLYNRKYQTEKAFEASCLEEYSEHYPCVGIDHTYYAWPNAKTLQTYQEQTPDDFKFILKATEKSTVIHYPNIKRYGKLAGKDNPEFLNAPLFLEHFLSGIEPIKKKVGMIIFEFSHFYPGMIKSGGEFVAKLDFFLEEVRKETEVPLAIEMRNATWLKEPYFKVLERQATNHVFNSWTKMPPIHEQLKAADVIRPKAFVSRLLLEPGTKYEEAVEAFSPYDKIQKPLISVREDTVKLVLRAMEFGVPAYVLVNNRLEGCALKTIEGILDLLENHLK